MPDSTAAMAGPIDPQQPGNPTGASCSGIGVSCLGSSSKDDFSLPSTSQASYYPISTAFTGITQGVSALRAYMRRLTVTAGSGYSPDGLYRVLTTGGGQYDGAGESEFTVSGGKITAARIVRPGSDFGSTPTHNLASAVGLYTGTPMVGGTGGAIVVTLATGNMATPFASMGTPTPGKSLRRVTSTGPVAQGAAITPSTTLNFSGHDLVAGESLWGVDP